MNDRITRFIARYSITPDNVMYIVRSESKTCIHLTNGAIIETYFSVKNILSELNTNNIICINKGTAVSCANISSIKSGIYTMSDGAAFKGRVRTPGEHKRNCAKIGSAPLARANDVLALTSDNIPEKFSIIDDLPLPFAVFEITLNDNGTPADMIFRYLNDAMADLVDSSVEETLGKSFYDVFENGDKKWMEINADISLKPGDGKSLRRFSPEIGRYLSIYYYCPLTGFSACAIV